MGWMCGSATSQPFQLIHHRHHPSTTPQLPSTINPNTCSFPQFPSTCRLKNVVEYRTRERLIVTCASSSKSNLSGGESSKDKSGGISSDAEAKGPPFLTIVAGLVVFFCIIWVFGSIIMWLLGPILKLASSK
ncbi:hypothetical protein M5689_001333 [Euphorbia peplus]|nr:hypothetical protein M5689_001333 [Euphorbia peplus]